MPHVDQWSSAKRTSSFSWVKMVACQQWMIYWQASHYCICHNFIFSIVYLPEMFIDTSKCSIVFPMFLEAQFLQLLIARSITMGSKSQEFNSQKHWGASPVQCPGGRFVESYQGSFGLELTSKINMYQHMYQHNMLRTGNSNSFPKQEALVDTAWFKKWEWNRPTP